MAVVVTQAGFGVRWMLPQNDIDAAAIEQSYLRPWTARQIRSVRGQLRHVGIVAETPEQVVGFAIYRFDLDELELIRIGVDVDFRRLGVATRLVESMAETLTPQRRTRIVAYVPDDLLDLHLFLQARGFRAACHGERYRFERRLSDV